MADAKISALTELAAAPAVGDLLVLDDVSDTTQAASGTTKKLTISNLLKSPTLGVSGADSLTINSGTWTLGSNYVATRAAGVSASGQSSLLDYAATLSGHADGTTNVRTWRTYMTVSGSNSISATTGNQTNVLTETTAGTISNLFGAENNVIVGGAGAITTASGLVASAILTSTGNVTTAAIVNAGPLLTGAGNISNNYYFNAAAPAFTSTGAITTNQFGFQAGNLGHATLVTGTVVGFQQADFTLGAATLSVGFRSQMTSGTGKWAFYSSGTAASAFAGSTRFGSVVAPTKTVDVTGTLGVSGATSLGTLGVNGVAAVAQSTGWAVSNVTTDKVFNANATSIDELADVLGTLVTYLISRGDLAA